MKAIIDAHFPAGNFWIGATDKQNHGEWKWTTTGEKLEDGFTNWKPEYPKDDKDWDCGYYHGMKWGNHVCYSKKKILCQVWNEGGCLFFR